jgi:hypothetical protein
MSNQQPCTREQLADEYHWSQFPESIQERLYAHYVAYSHQGNFQRAERDIQSATDALSWVNRGEPLAPFLKEHRRYFGEASAADLADIAELLVALQQAASAQSNEPGGPNGVQPGMES